MKILHLFLYCFLLLNIYNITALNVDAGIIGNNREAERLCPKICRNKNMTVKGQWNHKDDAKQYAVCGCVL